LKQENSIKAFFIATNLIAGTDFYYSLWQQKINWLLLRDLRAMAAIIAGARAPIGWNGSGKSFNNRENNKKRNN